MEKGSVEIFRTPSLDAPSLVVAWQTRDLGELGSQVANALIDQLGGRELAEINPLGFFPLGGTRFKNDIVQLQENKFWECEGANLLILKSEEPEFDHYRFINTILNFTRHDCHAKELYTISGALSQVVHTHPRRIFAVFNQPQLKEHFQGYGLEAMTWEGPPAISSYLLWLAQRIDFPGISLWPEIPFYLAAREDPQAIQLTLSFFNKRFEWRMNLEEFDTQISRQHEKLAQLRRDDAEAESCFRRLEKNLPLDEEEQMALTRRVHDVLTGVE